MWTKAKCSDTNERQICWVEVAQILCFLILFFAGSLIPLALLYHLCTRTQLSWANWDFRRMPFKQHLSQSCLEWIPVFGADYLKFIKWPFRFFSLLAISFNLLKWIMFYLQWSSLSKNLFQKLVSRGFWSIAENKVTRKSLRKQKKPETYERG